MKKIVSVFLAVVLVVSMSSVAFAADGDGSVSSFSIYENELIKVFSDRVEVGLLPISTASPEVQKTYKDFLNGSKLNFFSVVDYGSVNTMVFLTVDDNVKAISVGDVNGKNRFIVISPSCNFTYFTYSKEMGFSNLEKRPQFIYPATSSGNLLFLDGSVMFGSLPHTLPAGNERYLSTLPYVFIDDLVPRVTVNYNYEDGSIASPTISNEYNEGDSYSIFSPVIDGYYPSLSVVDGVNLTESFSVNVIYKPIEYNVFVNYSYSDGSEAFPTVNSFYHLGDKYNIASPVLNGYIPSVSTVSGEIIKGSETTLIYDVIYKKLPINLTVNYKYDDGSQAVPPYVNSFYEGDKYEIISPKISGFSPNPSVVRGTVQLNSSDMVFDVVYSPSLAIVSADDFAPFISGFIVGLTSLVATGLLLYIALLSVRLIPSIFEWFTKM